MFTLLFVLTVSFLFTAGLVWVACWALALVGVVVVWSWKLAFVVWILAMVARALFG
ncbi:MAG: hypothetical protein J6R67_03060 [Treponema sp.]|nr:hypothetical protein [Treponema sp.]